jgi:hypothetical protein
VRRGVYLIDSPHYPLHIFVFGNEFSGPPSEGLAPFFRRPLGIVNNYFESLMNPGISVSAYLLLLMILVSDSQDHSEFLRAIEPSSIFVHLSA